MTVLTNPNPLLRKKTADVPLERLSDPAFQKFLDSMAAKMLKLDGIGLAANQIGESLNIAVVNMGDTGPIHFLNSRIVVYGKKRATDAERCFSVPGVVGTVPRSVEISVTALDRQGRTLSFTARDLFARVLQHEIDHLNGILFIDRAEKIWQDIDEP